MSIVYVHGVATRNNGPDYQQHLDGIKTLLDRYVSPVISNGCKVFPAYWGNLGATFAWDGASRPRTVLRGQGAGGPVITNLDRALTVASVDSAAVPAAPAPRPASVLVPAGPSTSGPPAPSSLRLKDLRPDQLSDLLATTVVEQSSDPLLRAKLIIAADEVAHDPATAPRLAACANAAEEFEALRKMLEDRKVPMLAAQGTGLWSKIVDRVSETVSRVDSSPAYALSTVLGEIRPALNDAVTLFIGDVFTYLDARGDASNPGEIPRTIIDTLREAKLAAPGEPLVVLTHSMGGQLVYDLVTYFLPHANSDLRIDFWCATASQVGLFEEMKRFPASDPAYSKATGKKVPYPDSRYLGGWWNVWDHNDFISYTAAPIIEGVDDEPYDSGVAVTQAHGEYLMRPSFYRKFADKLTQAKQRNWGRP